MRVKTQFRSSWLLPVILASCVVLSAAAGRRSVLQDGFVTQVSYVCYDLMTQSPLVAEDPLVADDAPSIEQAAPELIALGEGLLFGEDQVQSDDEVAANSEPKQSVASAATAAISSGTVTAQQLSQASQAVLDSHNKYRKTHQVAPLTWSDTVELSANTYANKCIWGHDPENAAYGENLYATSLKGNPTAYLIAAVDNWYNEVRLVDWSKPEEMFDRGAGHFTQIVWSTSTQLGCAAVACPKIKNLNWASGGTIIVCRYSPPGNYIGRFAENVFPPGTGVPRPPTPPPSTPPTLGSPPPTPSPTPSANTLTFSSKAALNAGMSMARGDGSCLSSDNGAFALCMTATGNVTLARTSPRRITWHTNTRVPVLQQPAMLWLNDQDASLSVIDRSFNTYNMVSGSCASCKTPARSVLVLRNDGNLVLYARAKTTLQGVEVAASSTNIVWQSGTVQRNK